VRRSAEATPIWVRLDQPRCYNVDESSARDRRRRWRTSTANKGSLFREMKLNRGHVMQLASEA
jgi:hypothetical protein